MAVSVNWGPFCECPGSVGSNNGTQVEEAPKSNDAQPAMIEPSTQAGGLEAQQGALFQKY